MTDIVLVGACGKMGKVIADIIAKRDDCRIAFGVDINAEKNDAFPVYSNIFDSKEKGDVVIDFSHPSSLSNTVDYCEKADIPLVECTTGLSCEQEKLLYTLAKKVAVFYSGNMSLGINLLIELAKAAASVLSNSFDIEIIEKHHNQKIDAPSGTALMIANELSKTLATNPEYVYDRHSIRKKRSNNEIGIHSIRGGNIVGEHEVLFAGNDETLSITHTAGSKAVFAEGAINAALFLAKKNKGLYDMGDLLKSKL